MYLKRIEINGFKSFANKTEIILNSKITGVVGPNGSGKSNISDAIRWVLGEQSSKSLRGAKMEDVIFNGTAARAKKAFAEVSLVFDNTDGKIDSEYSEIMITRKMYRSGESEYLINHSQVRLKDIVDLMRDTGIGKEGYSIVGQGKIDEILENRPAARRRVIEEAAGIMKFRARKEEAELKLEKTDENIARITDILSELEAQLEPLTVQAEKAKEYLRLFEREKIVDATLFIYNYDRFTARLEKLTAELKDTESEIEELKSVTGSSSEDGARMEERLERLTVEKDELNFNLTELAKKLEKHTGELALLDERRAGIMAEIERATEEKSEKKKIIGKYESAVAEILDKKDGIEAQAAEAEEKAGELIEEISEIDAGIAERRGSLFKEKDKTEQIINEINRYKSETSAAEAKIEETEKRQKELIERIEALQKDTAEKNMLVLSERRELKNAQNDIHLLVTEMNEKKFIFNSLKKERAAVEESLSAQKTALARARSEKQLLLDMKAEYDGYSDSVKSLMREAKNEPSIKKLIRGTLAELIKVPQKYETAIEIVLGNTLQNVIVDDEENAKRIIEFLHEKKLGRVTFMPLNALKVNLLSKEEKNSLTDKGFIAVASDVIEFDEKIRPAVEFVLARTVLVEDMDSAVRVMRKGGYSFRAVTLKGDFIRPGGVMTGGSAGKQRFGLLSREHRIEDADARIRLAQAELKGKEDELAEKDALMKQSESETEKLADSLSALEIAAAERRERITARENMIDAAADTEMTLNSEYSQLEARIAELKKKCAEYEEIMSELAEKAENARKVEEDFNRSEGDRLKKKEELSEKLGEYKIRLAELKKELEALEENENRINGEKEQTLTSIDAVDDRINGLKDKASAIIREKQETAKLRADAEGRLAEVKAKFEKKEAERAELNERVQIMRKTAGDARQRQTELFEHKFRLDSQIEKATLLKENSQQKLWEDYELTYASAKELKAEIGYTAAMQESGELRARIRDIGPVNPNAIEDCARISERAVEMRTQKEDMERAKEDLHSVINSLLSAMRTTFTERFGLLNEHFKRIFTDLFGGGCAELVMGEGDILEAGIDVTAEPPGKKLQQLSLLSGGERALTAIALLFAMISINPSPVCLFDEIDAPLDEDNARLFSEYLRKIDKTQFVVITHRKPTMALCDSLYGVAMQEKGVSTLVSVNLKESAG